MCLKYKRKTEGGRTFTIRTIKDWNCMNAHIRNNGSLISFKHVFKSFLAEQKATMLLRLYLYIYYILSEIFLVNGIFYCY